MKGLERRIRKMLTLPASAIETHLSTLALEELEQFADRCARLAGEEPLLPLPPGACPQCGAKDGERGHISGARPHLIGDRAPSWPYTAEGGKS